MTILAFKIFLTCIFISWCVREAEGYSGKFSTLLAFIGIAAAIGIVVSGFAWVMLFIWLPW
jgi:hypothetical protein